MSAKAPNHPCPACQGSRKKAAPGTRGGHYYYCRRCRKATLVGELTRPPIQPADARNTYRHQDKTGALQQLLHHYEHDQIPAPQLALESGVAVRTIYRRLSWARRNRLQTDPTP